MMALRWPALAALWLALAATIDPAAAEQRRVALVIGNGDYVHTTALANAANDGRAMAAKLRELDFEVLEGIDLDRRATEEMIQQFARRLRGAEVGLFFYAGHGLQVNAANYVIPIDAALQDESDLDFEAIRLDIVLNQLERQPRTSLVFLDACRDNPLARTLARGMGASRSAAIGRGLARIDGGIGTLIAYATEPDNVALDGEGPNSPFTTALLRNIDTPGLEIRQMLTRVRQQVIDSTDRQQVPWDHSSLTGNFFFRPAVAAPEPPPVAAVPATPAPSPSPDSGATELMMWQTVQAITVPEQQVAALNLYLESYPQGQFAQLAEIQIAALSNPPAPPAPTAGTPPEPVAAPPPPAVDPAAVERSLGLTRDDLRGVQAALTLLGHDTRGIDGLVGRNTRRALSDYQAARGFPATGYLSAEVLTALLEEGIAAAGLADDGANSCQWSFDGECDEGRYYGNVTGACDAGTDTFDCQGLSLRGTVAGNDTCEWARDGECDEGRYYGNVSHACAAGTDATDCRGHALRAGAGDPANSCQWAFDGECDDARYRGSATAACAAGTDTDDCRGLRLR